MDTLTPALDGDSTWSVGHPDGRVPANVSALKEGRKDDPSDRRENPSIRPSLTHSKAGRKNA